MSEKSIVTNLRTMLQEAREEHQQNAVYNESNPDTTKQLFDVDVKQNEVEEK